MAGQVRVGATVRVRGGHRNPDLEGMIGTVMRTYVSPVGTALHVRLEDGRWQLFRPQELEELTEEQGIGNRGV